MPSETNVQLFRADSAGSIAVIRILMKPFLPTSLTILGPLWEAAHSPAVNSYIWSTFPVSGGNVEQSAPPHLFAFFLLCKEKMQCRFFCSAECSPTPATTREKECVGSVINTATQEEATFVISAFRALVKSAFAPLAHIHGELALLSGITVGSVHEKWVPCLQPLALRS